MTEDIYFDTDCLSALIVAGELSLPATLCDGKVYIPQIVYDEACASRDPQIITPLNRYIRAKIVTLVDFMPDDEAAILYKKISSSPDEGYKLIGKGESAAIALAKCRGGILASNNLKDVSQYIEHYNIKHVTTGQIIHQSVCKGLITEEDAENAWNTMTDNYYKLGARTYKEYAEKEMWKIDYSRHSK